MIGKSTTARAAAVWVPSRAVELEKAERGGHIVAAGLLLGVVVLIALGLDVSYMAGKAPVLVATIPLMLLISFWSILLACLLGFVVALGLLSDRASCYVPAKSFVSMLQGVPLVVVLFLIYFGLPQLNSALLLTPVQAGILGLGMSNAAYLAEVFRSSLLSVPTGQSEAARAIGMSESQRMRRIVLPQAARIALPPTANYYIFILKDSALVGFIGVAELFVTARSIGQRDFQMLEMLALAGCFYWIITIALSSIQRMLEQRMETAYVRET